MIRLNQLELTNFLSHVKTSIDMSQYEGLVLIEGITSDGHYSSNGAGKSTLLEGIVYALTGDTLRGVGVNDVVNRNYKKNTRVSLNFTRGDTEYAAIRYRKDDIRGDSLVLMKGPEDISKRVNKETQKSLDDILGISYKVLVSTMLLGEGLSARFTQLSDPEKKSLIESTLNLQYDMTAIRAKANARLSQLKLDKSNLEGRLSTLKELSALDVEKTRLSLEEIESQASQTDYGIESLQSRLNSLKSSKENIDSKISLLSSTLYKFDAIDRDIARIEAEIQRYTQELNSIETADDPHCTLCHQSLVSEESKLAVRSSYSEKISIAQGQLKDARNGLLLLPPRDVVEEKYKELSNELSNIDADIQAINQTIINLTNQMWTFRSQADQLRADLKRYEESTSDISSLEEESDRLTQEIEKYDYFYKLFSPTGIIVNILSDAIEYINTRLATYSEVLLEKSYAISFVKGKISLVDSKGSSYQSLSNGEKRRLDIAIQFALHDYVNTYCNMSMDTVFIDEILDTLDDVGVENIFDVLRLKLEYCHLKSIFVITHNNALKDKFDRVITVKKDSRGDSRVV